MVCLKTYKKFSTVGLKKGGVQGGPTGGKISGK